MSADRPFLPASSAAFFNDPRQAPAALAGYAIAPASSLSYGPISAEGPRIVKSGPMFADAPKATGNLQDDGKPRNIYVLNLPHELSQLEFEQLFSPFGRVEHACLLSMLDHLNRRRGFILMSSHEQAVKVLHYMHGRVLDGFRLDLTWAQVQKSSQLEVQRTRMLHAQRFKPPPTEPDRLMAAAAPMPNPLRKSSSADMGSTMPRDHVLHGLSNFTPAVGTSFSVTHDLHGVDRAHGAIGPSARYRNHSAGDVRLVSGHDGSTTSKAQDDQFPMTLLVEGLDAAAFPTVDHVAHFFAEYGHVLSIRPQAKQSAATDELSALVEFASMEDAAYASGMCHGKLIGRFAIKLNAVPRAQKPDATLHGQHAHQAQLMPTLPAPASHPPSSLHMPASLSDPFWGNRAAPTSNVFKSPSASVGRAQGAKHHDVESWTLHSPSAATDASNGTRSPWSSTQPTPSGTLSSFDPFGSGGVGESGTKWYSSSVVPSVARGGMMNLPNFETLAIDDPGRKQEQQKLPAQSQAELDETNHLLRSTLEDLTSFTAAAAAAAPSPARATSDASRADLPFPSTGGNDGDSLLPIGAGAGSSAWPASTSLNWQSGAAGGLNQQGQSSTITTTVSSSIVSYEDGAYVVKPLGPQPREHAQKDASATALGADDRAKSASSQGDSQNDLLQQQE